jgi:hypothetical protein
LAEKIEARTLMQSAGPVQPVARLSGHAEGHDRASPCLTSHLSPRTPVDRSPLHPGLLEALASPVSPNLKIGDHFQRGDDQ